MEVSLECICVFILGNILGTFLSLYLLKCKKHIVCFGDGIFIINNSGKIVVFPKHKKENEKQIEIPNHLIEELNDKNVVKEEIWVMTVKENKPPITNFNEVNGEEISPTINWRTFENVDTEQFKSIVKKI